MWGRAPRTVGHTCSHDLYILRVPPLSTPPLFMQQVLLLHRLLQAFRYVCSALYPCHGLTRFHRALQLPQRPVLSGLSTMVQQAVRLAYPAPPLRVQLL